MKYSSDGVRMKVTKELSQNDYTTQGNSQIQCNSYQIAKAFSTELPSHLIMSSPYLNFVLVLQLFSVVKHDKVNQGLDL